MEYIMLRPVLYILLCAVVGSISGCSSVTWTYTPGAGWSPEVNEKKSDSFIEKAWRAGGGFNNPNPERIREGKSPLNLDGSVYKR